MINIFIPFFLLILLIACSKFTHADNVSGSYKNINGINSYSYSYNSEHYSIEHYKSPYIYYSDMEYNNSYNSILVYGKLLEHSKSLGKIEKTVSFGYPIWNYCAAYLGCRQDYVSNSAVLYVKCGYKYEELKMGFSLMKANKSNTLNIKAVYHLNNDYFLSYRYKIYSANLTVLNWDAEVIEFGFNF